jgi:DNA-binding MarR family transcriptional regulator
MDQAIESAPLRTDVRPTPHPPIRDIRDLLTFRLAVLSSASDKIGSAWLQREFDLRVVEWRVLGVVAAEGPAQFRDIARALLMDKGQLSRLIKTLVTRKLIRSEPDRSDQRTIRLRLTAAGERLHTRVLARALERNGRVMSALHPDEAQTLFALLDKLQPFMTHRAEQLERDGDG